MLPGSLAMPELKTALSVDIISNHFLKLCPRMGYSQMAIPTVPPRDRTLIIRPLAVAISSGGVDSWATVTRRIRHIPKPKPSRTGYPHTALELAGVDDTIQAKKAVKKANATNVANRTSFLMAVYRPTNKEAKKHAMNIIANRTPLIRPSVS
jgi:hypothetical protein